MYRISRPVPQRQMPGSALNPASWPCVHTYDPRLSEAAHPSRSLLHCLLVLLGQVEQSVFYRLCGNSSKPKVTERGQSWPHRSGHFQKTLGALRRLTGSINRPPIFSSEPCATLWFRHPLLCACPHLKSEENPIPSTAFSRPNGCGPLSQSESTATSRLPRPSSKANSLSVGIRKRGLQLPASPAVAKDCYSQQAPCLGTAKGGAATWRLRGLVTLSMLKVERPLWPNASTRLGRS